MVRPLLLCLALLGPAAPAIAGESGREVGALPPAPADSLAVAWMPAPGSSVARWMASPAWVRLQADDLGRWLRARAAESGLQLVRGLFWGLAEATPARLLDALVGDGLLGVLLPPAVGSAQPGFAVLAAPRELDTALTVLSAVLAWNPDLGPLPEGTTWEVPVGEALLARRGPRLLLTDGPASLAHWDARGAATSPPPPGLVEALGALHAVPSRAAGAGTPGAAEDRAPTAPAGSDLLVWFDARLLHLGDEGLPERLDDVGASLLLGHLHQALVRAPWGALELDLGEAGLHASLTLPTGEAPLGGPFFPAPTTVAVPELDGALASLVLGRDLGPWWTRRDEWLSPRGLAEAVEPDGNLSLLFQRDFGPEVLAALRPEVVALVAEVPRVGARPEPELPGLVLGFTPRDDAPEDLSAAFVNAFLALITFSNFDGGDASRGLLEPDIEALPDGSRLYRARWRPWRGEGPPPMRYNLAPGLLLARDGRLWLGTDDLLLRMVASADERPAPVDGWRLELDGAPLVDLLAANRPVLEARQLLEHGGDERAAAAFVTRLLEGAALFDELLWDQRARGSTYRVTLELATR